MEEPDRVVARDREGSHPLEAVDRARDDREAHPIERAQDRGRGRRPRRDEGLEEEAFRPVRALVQRDELVEDAVGGRGRWLPPLHAPPERGGTAPQRAVDERVRFGAATEARCCGRTEANIEEIVNELHQRVFDASNASLLDRPVKLAVMGCVVNGPGEAEDADLAVAFGRNEGLIYKDAKPLRKVPFDQAVNELLKEWKLYVQRTKR